MKIFKNTILKVEELIQYLEYFSNQIRGFEIISILPYCFKNDNRELISVMLIYMCYEDENE